jgi:small neutral amino acid transporter SnatA (MarC family)
MADSVSAEPMGWGRRAHCIIMSAGCGTGYAQIIILIIFGIILLILWGLYTFSDKSTQTPGEIRETIKTVTRILFVLVVGAAVFNIYHVIKGIYHGIKYDEYCAVLANPPGVPPRATPIELDE